ncbi:Fe(3+)-hydroxamate ABC transporter permease FhuB [Azospirillum sp. ST 5-10]|uniref:Fe(3+)-hydroxamate ABC transporter permease FhuB n=1 Tax=unclassified Azospirillum TaxID=2630922 RepID=UPI003F4A4778
MTDAVARAMPVLAARPLPWLAAGLAAAALALTLLGLADALPPPLWREALWAPDAGDFRQLRFHHAALPRVAVALLAGGALGLAGALYQAVLRNPLAEPTTLGVSAGAHLALGAALLYAPWLLDGGREWVALSGAVAATALVLALAAGRGMTPLSLVLAGMIVGLYASSVGAVLVLFHHERMGELFIWQSGSLVQNGWHDAAYLAPRVASGAVAAALMARPLALLALDDDSARSLGLGLSTARLAGLAVATALSAVVVATVGVIGFVGLAAPTLARLTGARRPGERLLWSTLLGAVLLWLADQAVQTAGRFGPDIPTGVATAVLGAPLLLVLLRLVRSGALRPAPARPPARLARPGRWLAGGAVLLGLLLWTALALGRDTTGWHWAGGGALEALLPWRAPRVAAALGAGAALAVAGLLLQRMTGNGLASPEVLGVSSGAALGVVLLIAVVPAFGTAAMLGAATAGAGATTAAILWLGRRDAFAPERLLLAGIALGTFLVAVTTFIMASGDPRLGLLLSWMAGSTYRVTEAQAATALAGALVPMVLALPALRWLRILPLGDAVGRALGLDLGASRLVLLLLASVLTAAATLTVGPLSFVGLMAPHMARLLGLRAPAPAMIGSALLGGAIMVGADWAGRMAIFPWEIPAGLFATFIGGPYLMWLMRR